MYISQNIYDFENGYTGLGNQYLITPLDATLVQYERTLCPLLERGQKIDFLVPYITKNYNVHRALPISSSSPVTITATPPLTFTADSSALQNYRIYGNTQTINQVEVSVGNYQNGQYRIPISITHASTISPINIDLPYPLRKVGTEYEYIDYENQKMYRKRKNLLEPVNDSSGRPYGVSYNISNGTILLNGTADRTTELVKTNFKKAFYMPTCLDDGGTGVLHFCNSAAADVTVSFLDYYAKPKFSVTLDEPNKIVTKYPTGGLQTLWISIGIVKGATYSNLVIEPMLCNGITAVTEFEEYFPKEESVVDITLPKISVAAGTNTLSVGTTVQPAEVSITGKINNQ